MWKEQHYDNNKF
uniref:Uncharacterized protein n=1 Tax=Lepeophtheirus salmonis TaxID=72036 RepID=A0A0K2VLJ0_LEPSM